MSLRLELPVRIDFLGGWTDQECWEGPGAVLNAAVGWDGRYPLSLSEDGEWQSAMEGEGTGLGISSIRQAGEFLVNNENMAPVKRLSDEARRQAIEWSVCQERETTRGGWQDAAGALYPGLKVVGGLWPDLSVLTIPPHFAGGGIFETVVLFDTGVRRDSREIGERVRELMDQRRLSIGLELQRAVSIAPRLLFAARSADVREAAKECITLWGRLCEYVPPMRGLLPPVSSLAWGYKLCGAGGGGYGLMFCAPADREHVRDHLLEHGLWATIPELLPGPRWVEEPEAQ